jgi:hypothetical protein
MFVLRQAQDEWGVEGHASPGYLLQPYLVPSSCGLGPGARVAAGLEPAIGA